MSESLLFLYFWAFFAGPFSFDKLLFWISLAGLIGAVILTVKGVGENKWRWLALFAAELLGLVIAVSAAKWGSMAFFDGAVLSARTSSVFLAVLLAVTVVVWLLFRKKNRKKT